jgi:4-hydroxybenzoate polyprenyltransferase
MVVAFNWANVLIFDLANQRSPESVQEDLINKPWRPIPAGKITAEQTRRAMLFSIPIVLGLNYLMGVWREGLFIHIMVWMYNDLRGGDEIARDLIISIAYGFFNGASLQIAIGPDTTVSSRGYIWTAIISGVILTTMQVQDLKDQAGDSTRGRMTIPLWLGDHVSRFCIAFFVPFWTCACAFFWNLSLWAFLAPGLMSIIVSSSVLLKRTSKEDSRTWKLWCLWTVSLYLLPVLNSV